MLILLILGRIRYNNIGEIMSTTKNVLKKLAKIATLTVCLTVIFSSIVYVSARAPETHSYLLRSYVGERVYIITDQNPGPGGTGFSVKAKSGKTFIVTNAHVCALSRDTKTILINTEDGKHIRRRIIKVSGKSDLCLIDGLKGVTGLSVGPSPEIGQIIASVGHPSLLPLTLSRGEIITRVDVTILKGIVNTPEYPMDMPLPGADLLTPDQCKQPKNKIIIQTVNFGFGGPQQIALCLDITKKAYKTNMIILPGSSGSPVVDFWGRVVGVAFAGDQNNWGAVVSIDDLKDLLSKY